MVVSANLNHDPWAREARAHWQKYRPKMFKQMQEDGSLEHHLRNAVQRAEDQFVANAQAGMHPLEAESEAKKQHLLLPDEDDMPLLGENPDALPDPANVMTAPSGNRRKRIKKQSPQRELTD